MRVPASIAAARQSGTRAAGVRMLSHDDKPEDAKDISPPQGVRIAEFPVNEETAREAAEAGDYIVFGAPNVVRGGSHTGWTKAGDMIAKGLCSVLASDYYYPAQIRLPHSVWFMTARCPCRATAAPAPARGGSSHPRVPALRRAASSWAPTTARARGDWEAVRSHRRRRACLGTGRPRRTRRLRASVMGDDLHRPPQKKKKKKNPQPPHQSDERRFSDGASSLSTARPRLNCLRPTVAATRHYCISYAVDVIT